MGYYDGAYKVTHGLLKHFGEKRVVDAPIAEAGFAGVGIGAAMVGLRPIIEFMTWNFSFIAFDQLINHAAKIHMMSGGQFHVPIVFRGPSGAAKQVGSQHSHSVEAWYSHAPGLLVVIPSTPRDAKGLLKTAIRDNNPVVFLEHETLYSVKGQVLDEGKEELIPFGTARIARKGEDCSIITWSKAYYLVMEAAEKLDAIGIHCVVIDLRTLRPLDTETVISSVKKTNRCVVVHEHWPYGGPGAEIVDRIQSLAFDYLDAPVKRVSSLDVPMPYALHLEQTVLPSIDEVMQAVQQVMYDER